MATIAMLLIDQDATALFGEYARAAGRLRRHTPEARRYLDGIYTRYRAAYEATCRAMARQKRICDLVDAQIRERRSAR